MAARTQTPTIKAIGRQKVAKLLAEKYGLSQESANAILDDTIRLIAKNLKTGTLIRLAGLGLLVVRKQRPRLRRNPATGEGITIKASKKAVLRTSKGLPLSQMGRRTKKKKGGKDTDNPGPGIIARARRTTVER